MKGLHALFIISLFTLVSCIPRQGAQPIVIDETGHTESIEQIIDIDQVWAGHPVAFCLYTHEERQYIAYFHANRQITVGQRALTDDQFERSIMPPTFRETAGGTSTVLGWDSHNDLTIGVDKDGYIHLAGNMHNDPITYFKSTKPNDISTLVQQQVLIGPNERMCTYPAFMLTKEGELVFHYRDGGSGNGNEIYNIYSCETQRWSRMLDVPLTDGQGLMNAYQSQPTVLGDGWYHVYWVWRDSPDCQTNHDLSYMKSPDLKRWFNALGEPIALPATLSQRSLIVDPIPVKGGIINLAAELCLDEAQQPVFTYHKYDSVGNVQLYVAHLNHDQWNYQQVTQWDYRWAFAGGGSIDVEVRIDGFHRRDDSHYEIDYWHIKYGNGTILLNPKFEPIGSVLKPVPFESKLTVEGDFPGLEVQTVDDIGHRDEEHTRYMLKWETLARNRDQPRPKPWPKPSRLLLYKLKK
jgi:hypothetical protein